jgi:DNA-binding MarR family transcriptional regulator
VGKLIYLEQHGQATASELADAFMVTRTLISRNTWRLIQDNLIQSAKIKKLQSKNSTQPK